VSWQIQARLKTGTEWEPVSVEPRNASTTERRYHYDTLEEAKAAFEGYNGKERRFPNLVARLATGRPLLREVYDVRFVQIMCDARFGQQIGAAQSSD